MPLEDYFNTGDTAYSSSGPQYRVGQNFVADNTYVLDHVRIKGYTGVVAHTLYAQLWTVDGAHKPLALVADTSFSSADEPHSAPGDWFSIDMSAAAYEVQLGQEYTLIIWSGSSSYLQYWRRRASTAFERGWVYTANGGTSWDYYSGYYEFMFEVWSYSGEIGTSFLIAGSGGLVINDDQIDVATAMEIAGDGSLSLTDFSIAITTEMTIAGIGRLMPSVLHVLRTYPYVWPMESPIFFPQLGWEIRKTKDPRYNTVTPKEVDGTTAGTWSAQEGMVMPQNEYDAALYLDIGEFWYEKAHLLPRLLNLGFIAASQSIDAELYNADRANPITVVGVVNNLGLGTTLSGLPALPFDVESQHSVTFTIEVGARAQLSVDGTLGFELSDGRMITLVATGQRIMLIPIRPEAPLREHLMFDTKILTRVDGSEVRIANRNTPRRMFEGTIASDRQRMEFLLFDRQSKMCAMPAWAEPAYVATAIAAGDDTITVNTTELSGFYENGYVVIFKDANHFDAVQIHTMTDTTLTFKTNILNDYATGIQVMPMLLGYFEANVPAQKALVNDQTFSIKFTVNAEDNDISSTAGWGTYSGKVLLDDPNMADEDGLSETFEDNIIVLDGTTGLMSQLSLWDKNKRNSKKGFKTDTREELWALKKLLYALKGQQVSFYIPTYSNDLTPLETLLNGDNSMTIERIGYTVNVRQRAPKAVIRVVLKSGTTVVRTITDSAIIDDETEELTVNTSWPSDIQPADIERIEFLEKVRISVDDIVIVHYNAIGVSKTIVPIKEVFD